MLTHDPFGLLAPVVDSCPARRAFTLRAWEGVVLWSPVHSVPPCIMVSGSVCFSC